MKFSAQHSFEVLNSIIVVLTLDENGKSSSIDCQNPFVEIANLIEGKEEPLVLPKRVMTAFTESAVNKILSKDEIPNESGMMVLDGYNYEFP